MQTVAQFWTKSDKKTVKRSRDMAGISVASMNTDGVPRACYQIYKNVKIGIVYSANDNVKLKFTKMALCTDKPWQLWKNFRHGLLLRHIIIIPTLVWTTMTVEFVTQSCLYRSTPISDRDDSAALSFVVLQMTSWMTTKQPSCSCSNVRTSSHSKCW